MTALEAKQRVHTAADLKQLERRGLDLLWPQQRPRIAVGMATCGLAAGANEIFTALEKEVAAAGLDAAVIRTGCIGYCQAEPLVLATLPGRGRVLLQRVKPRAAPAIVAGCNGDELPRECLLCILDGDLGIDGLPSAAEVGFFGKQLKVVLRNCGIIDPESLAEYVATGGYQALLSVLTGMQPTEVVTRVKESGLRGRGGAGFPTGLKWEITAMEPQLEKFVICNADEGDPGAYMDRTILEGDPHSVLEGMLIGAYAMGANQGLIYIRNEYPEAIRRFERAIATATDAGLLGRDILGTGFDFTVRIARGGGAFVCGEETALIASLEGWPGEPRQRPPFPSQEGLWGRPTNINNVETWANVPLVMRYGPEFLAALGTESSKGTKVFSLVGKVNNTGLIEVPMGITLREVVYDIGGGIPRDKCFKAIQTGGPSGGCLPESQLHLGIDYEQLTAAGTIMGSGGMIVMDDDTCMVDVARYFLDFLKEESCGKCTPCREGITHMLTILEAICAGGGSEADLERLEETAQAVRDFSLCGLGQTAPNPVLTTLRYFRDEYNRHIRDGKCPAGVCKALVTFGIDEEKCNGCGVCLKACPSGAITGKKKNPHSIDTELCIKCSACYEVCKLDAVRRE